MPAGETAKKKFGLAHTDVTRMRELYAEIHTALQKIASIEQRAVSEKDKAFAERTNGKSVIAAKIRAGRNGGQAAGVVRNQDLIVTMGPLCISYGSGPGMAMCYDDTKGVCYLDDGFD
jgi:hypothetical protein